MTVEQLRAENDELRAAIAVLQRQQSYQTEAIRALVGGRLDGPGSTKAYLLALNPTMQVDVAPFVFGE